MNSYRSKDLLARSVYEQLLNLDANSAWTMTIQADGYGGFSATFVTDVSSVDTVIQTSSPEQPSISVEEPISTLRSESEGAKVESN